MRSLYTLNLLMSYVVVSYESVYVTISFSLIVYLAVDYFRSRGDGSVFVFRNLTTGNIILSCCNECLCLIVMHKLITVYDTNYKLVPYIRSFPSATTYIPDNHKIQGKQHQVNGIVAHPTK